MQPKLNRIVIIDDHLIFAQGLKALIEKIKGTKIEALFDRGEKFLTSLKRGKINPQYLFVDINMPGIDGFETTRKTLEIKPSIKVVVMTMFDDGWSVKKMRDLHVCGYITKDTDPDDTSNAIRRILAGDFYISENAAVNYAKHDMTSQGISGGSSLKIQTTNDELVHLSEIELDIVKLIAQGNSDKKIALKIRRSPRTVGWHKYNIMKKIGAKKTIEIVAFAYRMKLV